MKYQIEEEEEDQNSSQQTYDFNPPVEVFTHYTFLPQPPKLNMKTRVLLRNNFQYVKNLRFSLKTKRI